MQAMLTRRQVWTIRIKDVFDPETGFFAYLMDKKCFRKKYAAIGKRIFPKMSKQELLEYAENAYSLHEGLAEELLLEIARRFKDDAK